MFLRIDKLQVELPGPVKQNPNAAAALQELLGGQHHRRGTGSCRAGEQGLAMLNNGPDAEGDETGALTEQQARRS